MMRPVSRVTTGRERDCAERWASMDNCKTFRSSCHHTCSPKLVGKREGIYCTDWLAHTPSATWCARPDRDEERGPVQLTQSVASFAWLRAACCELQLWRLLGKPMAYRFFIWYRRCDAIRRVVVWSHNLPIDGRRRRVTAWAEFLIVGGREGDEVGAG